MSKFSKVLNLDEATRVDVASSTVTYIGKAIPGSATSAPTWKVARLTTEVSGGMQMEFADSGNYTQIWDNRASLSYN